MLIYVKNNIYGKIKITTFVLLFSLIVFHFLNNYIWIKNDSFSFHKDVISHLNNQLTIFYDSKTILYSNITIINKLKGIIELLNKTTPLYWSPFFYFNNLIINLLFGHTLLTTRLLPNMVYFIILILSTFYLGKRYKNEETGLLAAFLVSFFSGIFGSSRMFGLDFPLTAMVSFSLCMLISTDKFIKNINSLILGVIMGLCLVIKVQGILFLVGPFSYVLYHAFIKKPYISRKKRFFNLSITLLIIIMILLLFYKRYFNLLILHFISHIKGNMIIPAVTNAKMFSFRWFAFYFTVIKNNISLPYFYLFIIYIFLFIKNKKIKDISFLLFWAVIPYIVFTITPLKDESFFFPGLPAIALIISLGITSHREKLRRILYCLLFVISMFNFIVLSYYGFRSGKIWQSFTPVKISKFMAGSQWAHPPREDRHQIVGKEFASIIKMLDSKTIKIGIIEEQYYRGDFVKCLEYFLKLYCPNAKIYLSCRGNWPFFLNNDFLFESSNFDYIIAFNKYPASDKPEFEGLKYFKLLKDKNREFTENDVDRFIQKLKEYTLVRKNFVAGSCIPVYLLSKKKIEIPGKYQAELPKPVTNLLIGEVVLVDPLESRLLIKYQDNVTKKYKQEEFFVGNGITSYENVLSIRDIRQKDTIIIDYYITKEKRKIILNINVDNILEIPFFSLEKISGNIREHRNK